MIRAVVERGPHVYHRVTGQHTRLERLAHALLGRPDKFARHRTADNAIDEFEALAPLQRLDADPHIAVLTAAAGLAYKAALGLCRRGDGLAIGHLRAADVGLHLKFTEHTVYDHL